MRTDRLAGAPQPCANAPSTLLQVAATPAEVAAACDITLAMLSDPEACLEVATGKRNQQHTSPLGLFAALAVRS